MFESLFSMAPETYEWENGYGGKFSQLETLKNFSKINFVKRLKVVRREGTTIKKLSRCIIELGELPFLYVQVPVVIGERLV